MTAFVTVLNAPRHKPGARFHHYDPALPSGTHHGVLREGYVWVVGAESASELAVEGCFGVTDEEAETDSEKQNWVDVVDIQDLAPRDIGEEVMELPEEEKQWKPHPDRAEANTLRLDLVEAFFISFGLGCLIVQKEEEGGELMSLDEMWLEYGGIDKQFRQRYRVYHHFRAKGWVVRSGVKFGADFLLYKEGPQFYHASYSVKVVTGDAVPDWRDLAGLNRVTEAAAKELVLAQVSDGGDDASSSPKECLNAMTVTEVLVRRWNPQGELVDEECRDQVRESGKSGKKKKKDLKKKSEDKNVCEETGFGVCEGGGWTFSRAETAFMML